MAKRKRQIPTIEVDNSPKEVLEAITEQEQYVAQLESKFIRATEARKVCKKDYEDNLATLRRMIAGSNPEGTLHDPELKGQS